MTTDVLYRLDSYTNWTHGRPASGALCVGCGTDLPGSETARPINGLCHHCQGKLTGTADILSFNTKFRSETNGQIENS